MIHSQNESSGCSFCMHFAVLLHALGRGGSRLATSFFRRRHDRRPHTDVHDSLRPDLRDAACRASDYARHHILHLHSGREFIDRFACHRSFLFSSSHKYCACRRVLFDVRPRFLCCPHSPSIPHYCPLSAKVAHKFPVHLFSGVSYSVSSCVGFLCVW